MHMQCSATSSHKHAIIPNIVKICATANKLKAKVAVFTRQQAKHKMYSPDSRHNTVHVIDNTT